MARALLLNEPDILAPGKDKMIRRQANGDHLATFADLVMSGKVKIDIETVLPLSEARKAQDISQKGHPAGKSCWKRPDWKTSAKKANAAVFSSLRLQV